MYDLGLRAAAEVRCGHHDGSEITLPEELLSLLEGWTFLLGSADDAQWLKSSGINAVEIDTAQPRGEVLTSTSTPRSIWASVSKESADPFTAVPSRRRRA